MLSFTTCLAINTEAVTAALATHLGRLLNIPTTYVDTLPWHTRYAQLDSGHIQIGWICGAPYTMRADTGAPLELLAAPVMANPRYGGQPIYFSEVVVRADSNWHTLADLQGQTWTYNEPNSQSGYHVVCHTLAQMGVGDNFFGRVFASGGHLRSIELVGEGRADGTAVDSTVWEWAQRHWPQKTAALRVIQTLGPSGMPPWVIHTAVPAATRTAVRHALLTLHEAADGRELLALGGLARFAAVSSTDYDTIRTMRHVGYRLINT